ncbi:MAG: hypothetical protein LBR70_04750 [Lactobacillaceae bacterium]|jgi:hypothetical protein|nr:hypothetical protein [Lactobacillaceae bacterium]
MKAQFGEVVQECVKEWSSLEKDGTKKAYDEEFLNFVKQRYNEKYGDQDIDIANMTIEVQPS